MLIDALDSHLISTLGWVDHGAVWHYDIAAGRARQVMLGDVRYLSLSAGAMDLFAAVHHYDANRLVISVHAIAAPDRTLARITLSDDDDLFEGDAAIWTHLPRAYVAYYSQDGVKDYYLFLVNAPQHTVQRQQLAWFDDRYDQAYQGIVGVTEVPGQEVLIICIQRDSCPVLYDPQAQQVVGHLTLAERGGNPTVQVRRRAAELWADDYDTLVRIDPSDWLVRNTLRVQGSPEGTAQFIGRFGFNGDESLCVVARPFSGDVLALDTHAFTVTHQAVVGRQPLDVALLRDGRVVARDWKSGRLLQGRLKHIAAV